MAAPDQHAGMRWPALLLLLSLLCGCARAAPLPIGVPAPAGVRPPPGPVRLWQDAAIFEPARALIAGAGGRVRVEMYEFDRDDLAAGLAGAHDRGAEVRLIVDPTVAASRRTAARLRAAGVQARSYPVDDRRHQIDHLKLLLTETAALVGGMNWGRGSATNHDYALELRDPAVLARLDAIFDQDWRLAGGRPAPLAPARADVAQTAPGQEIRDLIQSRLERARRSVAAEVFQLTDGAILADLGAAHRRGARVRVLLDPNQDVNLAAARLLAEAGVEVRWYPVRPPAKLHAKAALIDGQLVVGSANWTLGGLSANHELDVLATAADPVAAYEARFERDWAWARG